MQKTDGTCPVLTRIFYIAAESVTVKSQISLKTINCIKIFSTIPGVHMPQLRKFSTFMKLHFLLYKIASHIVLERSCFTNITAGHRAGLVSLQALHHNGQSSSSGQGVA